MIKKNLPVTYYQTLTNVSRPMGLKKSMTINVKKKTKKNGKNCRKKC